MKTFEITPDVSVYDLLEAFPQLEDVLIGIAPPFKKLKNPILRRSVAKVATLKHVSSVGKITIRSGLPPAEDFSVKVHELAHEFLHHTSEKLSKTQKETEAEAVAYVVCQSIGLDTNTAFSDYIQLYRGEKETLINSIQRIKDISGRIFSGLT